MKMPRRRAEQESPATGAPRDDDIGTSFAWEFERDELGAPDASGTFEGTPRARSVVPRQQTTSGDAAYDTRSRRDVARFAAADREAQAPSVRRQLDIALERWWANDELPPLALLRNGLRLLEAGGQLSEAQRTLLLHAALTYEKGVQTAIRHQGDAERTAIILAEAVVEWPVPIEPEQMVAIVGKNERVGQLLIVELERSRALHIGIARQRAQEALDYFGLLHASAQVSPPLFTPIVTAGDDEVRIPPRKPVRQLFLLMLVVAFIAFLFWQRQAEMPDGMVAMPAASYALLAQEGVPDSVPLAAFWIDEFEVTNRQYRACIEAGVCLWPQASHSVTRRDYLTNPAFDAFPVVNVTYAMAETYCAWKDKRLPSVEEWQVAASVSPTNGQAFRYPWGETFDIQRANGWASGIGDTVSVGAYRPGGDSASGATDMAGNVAEWTALDPSDSPDGLSVIVKGGSFLDGPDGLTVSAAVWLPVERASSQVGFRCARN